MNTCKTPYCRNTCKGSYCNTCKSRTARAADPVKYSYYTLRTNTIRRKGREFFALTLDEFRQYCYETDYIAGKGRTRLSHTIDCIDPTMGYFIGNIQPRTLAANAKKGKKILHYDWENKYATVETKNFIPRDFDMPF